MILSHSPTTPIKASCPVLLGGKETAPILVFYTFGPAGPQPRSAAEAACAPGLSKRLDRAGWVPGEHRAEWRENSQKRLGGAWQLQALEPTGCAGPCRPARCLGVGAAKDRPGPSVPWLGPQGGQDARAGAAWHLGIRNL